MGKSVRNTGGIIANAVAILGAIAAFPFLVIPMLKLGWVGLVLGGPVAVVLYVLAFLVIDVGPLVGIVVGVSGRARALPWVTAALSLGSLFVLIVGVQVARRQVDLDHDGRARGPAPASCVPKAMDGAAVGRACDPNGGEAPRGSCPDGYWCMVQVQGRPETTCLLACRHDCECPSKLKCKFEKCTR